MHRRFARLWTFSAAASEWRARWKKSFARICEKQRRVGLALRLLIFAAVIEGWQAVPYITIGRRRMRGILMPDRLMTYIRENRSSKM